MKNLRYFFILVTFGSIIYSQALFKPFQIDDLGQIVNSPLVHSLDNIPALFSGGSNFQGEKADLFHFQYRPLMMVFYAILYYLGGGSVFPFHFFQIVIFTANSILVFYFLKKFVRENIAFAAALLFLLSPVNIEVAEYIADLQDVLFVFFGMLALCLVDFKRIKGFLKYALIYISLLAAFLSKETGILFVGIVLLYVQFFKRQMFKQQIYISTAACALYFAMRIYSSQHIYRYLIDHQFHNNSLNERVLVSLTAMRFYIQEMILPGAFELPPFLAKDMTLTQGIISFGVMLALTVTLFAIGFVLKSEKRLNTKAYVFFCAWLAIGVTFHSHIITLDVFLAERWLYFPMLGAYGIIALIVNSYYDGTFRHKALAALVFVIIILFYMGQHFI